jgi:hypothetical protein
VVVNVSLGTEEADPEERSLVARLNEEGALVVAAAGNENSDRPFYPAAYPDALAVASADGQGKALHSNYGKWIDVAASGDITFIDYEFLPYERLRREMEARGTSFAAPRVTAALAWILHRRPKMVPAGAWSVAQQTVRPISGEHYAAGELGAGLLDLYRVKSFLEPSYRWLHYGLPLASLVAVVAGTILLCVRMRLVGVFISLLIWLVALPSAYLSALLLGRYLAFVRAGYRAEGALPLALAGVSCVVGAALVRLGSKAQLRALLPGIGVAAGLRLVGMGALLRALVTGGVFIAVAVWVEWRIRRRVNDILRTPEQLEPGAAADELAGAHQNAWDDRMRRAAREAVRRLPREAALARLRANREHERGARALVETLTGEPPAGSERPMN